MKARVRQTKKGERSLGWKTQKFTPGRLQMGSIFGCGRVSFGESPRTIVHCMIVCHTVICIHLMIGCCGIEFNVICSIVWLDLYWWPVVFGFSKYSNPPLTLWVLGTLLSNVEMFIPSFLYLFRCIYHSWGSTDGTGRTSGCPWSGLVERFYFFYCVCGIETL